MKEKFLDTLFEYFKGKTHIAVNVMLWLSLLVISFSRFIKKIDYKSFTVPEKIINYFLSGNYVLFISWSVCMVGSYLILKYLLTFLLPKSTIGIRFFFKYLIPDEYRIPMLDAYYKRAAKVSQEHLNKIVEYWEDNTIESDVKNKTKLSIITGIVLKFLIILFLVISNFNGLAFWVILLSILLCFLLLLFLITSITAIISKNIIHGVIHS